MTFKHCPECGSQLSKKEIGDEGDVPYCVSCKRPWFSFSYPCVICLVINENNEIALIKQSYISNYYVAVAGYVKQGETIEETACREVEEEIGLAVTDVKYFKSFYFEKRDNLMFGFVCRVQNALLKLSKEVDDANWFSLDEAVNLLTPGSGIQNMLKEYIQSIRC